ncbi:MAG: hypothetical protein ACHQ2Z_07555 [Elusimicrobiota bacterium]
MKSDTERVARACAAALALLGLYALHASAASEAAIRNWPRRSRAVASFMIEKYGEPDGSDSNRLVWYNNGQWRKTVVYRRPPRNIEGSRGDDILEQTISYDVPDDKVAALKSFDVRVKFDRGKGELSSRSENENYNYLALNLADEIVRGKRNPDEAVDDYRKMIRLSESGKNSELLYGFSFPLTVEPSGSPDSSGNGRAP